MEIVQGMDEQEVISLLRSLVEIPSLTGEEREIANFVASYTEAAGFSSTRVSDHWDVVACITGSRPGPKILFLTHTDHSKPSSPNQAYCAEMTDGEKFGKRGKIITGKGSCAPKSTLAAMLYAGKILAPLKDRLKGSFVLAAVSRDLWANHDGVREVADRGWIDSDMAVVGEPSDNQPAIGARGILHFTMTIEGKPTHWGRPKDGSNPIWSIPDLLKLIEDMARVLPSHPALGEATLVPIDIRCEMSPPHTPNCCTLLLDRRTLPGEDRELIVKDVEERLKGFRSHGQKATLQLTKEMHPFHGDPGSFISRKLMELHRVIIGRDPEAGYLSFSSNGGFLTEKMRIPSVAYGPGSIADLTPVEHAEISRVLAASKVYVGTALEILSTDL
jgi:acetylornithine deacetylase/succinyl-diaminopimelate desuccinylase-like protein